MIQLSAATGTPQNFSLPAGYDAAVDFTLADDLPLSGASVHWHLYEQALGVPVAGAHALLEKATGDSPADVTLTESPPAFTVLLRSEDTLALLRNYYHEATVYAESGEVIAVAVGILTVTATENR
jgi:hypothetical protein